jgi:hypothetical protein
VDGPAAADAPTAHGRTGEPAGAAEAAWRCLAAASFSLRTPVDRHSLLGTPTDDLRPEEMDRYDHASEVVPTLRAMFADADADSNPPGPGRPRFVLRPLGTRLHGEGGVVGADAARALVDTGDRLPSTVAFGVDDLQLPALFDDIATGPFERESWRPALLAAPAYTAAGAGEFVNANDCVVVPDGAERADGAVLARYLAAAFGQRRSYLFAPSFATRIHNVFLPAGELVGTTPGGPAQGDVTAVVVPFVTLVGSSAHRNFRRTVTVTLLVLPVERRAGPAGGDGAGGHDGLRLRAFADEELLDIAAQWDWSPARRRRSVDLFHLRGPLRTYLEQADGHYVRDQGMTLRSLSEAVLMTSATAAVLGRRSQTSSKRVRAAEVGTCRLAIEREALHSLHVAKASTILSWSPWPGAGASPATVAEADAAGIANLLFSTERVPLQSDILDQFALPRSPIPEGPYVGAYYVATHSTLVYSYVVAGTPRQQRGPIWMTAYVAYLGVALSSMRATLLALHREIDRASDSPDRLLRTAGALAELEEVFDLQFAVKTHRTYYEVIRRRDGALDDYDWLVKKVALLRDESMLRRQHTENQRVLGATVMIVVLTAVLAIPGALDLLTTPSAVGTRRLWGTVLVAIAALAVLVGAAFTGAPAVRAVRRWQDARAATRRADGAAPPSTPRRSVRR